MHFHPTDSSPAASPLQVLQAGLRPVARAGAKPGLLVAGATGPLGSEVLRRLAGSGAFSQTQVLAREPITAGLLQVGITVVGAGDIAAWPVYPLAVQTAVVMFEPSRLHHDRERALWTPVPGQLLALAHWLRRCGVQTLVLVLPHAQGSLPQALMQGLASIDEQAVAALGFERVLLVRSAQKSGATVAASALDKLAAWMLSIVKYMIPASAQPLRPVKLAEFIDLALRILPAGTHVAGPELLWQAAQARDMHKVVSAWLNTTEPTSAPS
jgi:uncharacterized protein YbjT (DUF2867 family)